MIDEINYQCDLKLNFQVRFLKCFSLMEFLNYYYYYFCLILNCKFYYLNF